MSKDAEQFIGEGANSSSPEMPVLFHELDDWRKVIDDAQE